MINDDKKAYSEVNLSQVSEKMGNIARYGNDFLFNAIQFIIRHIVILSIMLVVGVALGIYLDKNNKNYEHQIIVSPNFGSVDYLYAKIKLLNAKIQERDTMFLKAIQIKNPKKVTKIEIKPIVDVYTFINRNSNNKNFDLLKLMAEDGEISKIIEDPATSRNYNQHIITFSTKNFSRSDETVVPIMNFLNNSSFYRQIQKEYIKNNHIKVAQNQIMIGQIDAILNNMASGPGQDKNDKLVYYSENTALNEVLMNKDRLINEQGNYRIEEVSNDRIVKEISLVMNVENNKSVNGKMKLILPILLLFIYFFGYFFRNFYKSQSLKRIQAQ